MDQTRRKKGRVRLILIMLFFLGPLFAAWWLYFGQILQPAGRTNHGDLVDPVINLWARQPESSLVAESGDKWLMIYANMAPCDNACRQSLYMLRQAWLVLGNNMARVHRVFLHGESPPDRVFIEKQHQGLITIRDDGLFQVLAESGPGDDRPGGIYLLDPLGNLVMYFPPELDSADMVEDIWHLLESSRIG